ncbi:hypothetical protein C8R47DRAFT_923405, partial [Mycena vitilis]
GKFNRTGRGFPDISAQGEGFRSFGVQISSVAPVSIVLNLCRRGNMIAWLNGQLVAAGKAPLGFLNPFLYRSTGSARTFWCVGMQESHLDSPDSGSPASIGWDPVTGTPNFAQIKTAVGL